MNDRKEDKTKKGEITIYYKGSGEAEIDPPLGLLDRVHQKMVWRFVDESGTGARFAVPGGIYFPWPLDPPPTPPPTYVEWPGSVPEGDAYEYRADAKKRVDAAEFYAYYIRVQLGTADDVVELRKVRRRGRPHDEIIDPPIENQPEP